MDVIICIYVFHNIVLQIVVLCCFCNEICCLLSLFQLFERDPSRRLGVVGDIRAHPFFKTVNWPALEKREVEPPFKPKVVRAYDFVSEQIMWCQESFCVNIMKCIQDTDYFSMLCYMNLTEIPDPTTYRNPPVTAATLTESS